MLSRPIPIATEAAELAPAATLDRPAVFRAKTNDEEPPRLMPVGPAESAQQPGVAKPMTTAETLVMPRPIDNSATSNSYVFPVLRRRFERVNSPVEPTPSGTQAKSAPGGSAGDCVCDVVCEPCGDDCGGIGLLRRFRDRIADDFCRLGLLRRCRDECDICCDDPCCLPRPHAWIRGEYLLWNTTGQNTPPLLTGENSPIRSPALAGVLPAAPILFDDDNSGEWRSGGRVALGFWFPRICICGVDVSFCLLARRDVHAQFSSDAEGNPVLARPFFQPPFQGIAGGEAAELVAYPGLVAGNVQFACTTRLWGADANLRHRFRCGPGDWVDCFIGYRHFQLSCTLDINENLTNLQFAPGSGDTRAFLLHDHFATRNQFNGGQIGLEGELKLLRRWFLAANVKVAL